MTAGSGGGGKATHALSRVDSLVAQGQALAQALEAVGASESDYFQWRADNSGLDMAQVRRLCGPVDGPAVDPDSYIGRSSSGLCPVCGQGGDFVDFTENLRESGRCSGCGAINRQRQMAFMTRLCLGLPDAGALTLPPGLAVHNTESMGAVHDQLRGQPGYTCSEYWGPDHPPGENVDGVRNEDLQNLSFADDSLDVILSSDVFEHMPDPYRAHAEIFRVLKPGGRHIFTVPFHNGYADNVRATLEGGEIVYFGEKLYHGDPIRPDEGVLVWTIFGAEMLDRLRALGFHALLWKFSAPEHGIIGDALVFDARKPPALSPSGADRWSSRAVQAIQALGRRLTGSR